MASEEIVWVAAQALLDARHQDWPDLFVAQLEQLDEEVRSVMAAIEPLIREQIAKEIESQALCQCDRCDSLMEAAKIARGDHHE